MPLSNQISVWKQSPFIRLLIPVIAGILLEWYLSFSLIFIVVAATCFIVAIFLFSLFPIKEKFKLQLLQGICINLLLISFGLFITWQKDIRHDKNWFGNYYTNNNYLVVRIDEPVVEKARSYKADGYVEAIIQDDKTIACKGKLLLYFSKDSSVQQLHYGDKILINRSLQQIKNSGNPGCFNYERYAAFQQTFYNVFLKQNDWQLLDKKNVNHFKEFIYFSQRSIVDIIKKYVGEDKAVGGLAEALLIGYTNDLDKDIVQAYSNTGVVHIIAISGMHLGLIYALLNWIFGIMPFVKRSTLTRVILTLSCLWIFSILTGASASVLRSAVVFTFIAIGSSFNKRSSVYNSLAASAFILLCYNPYFLWDVGFQLSYLAVLGIIIFQKYIYHWFYIKNKCIDKLWEMIAVTLAAQILTFPICIYYFHQFPVLFLITNLIAIPLSTIILYAEIFLIAFWWVPYVGMYLGKVTFWLTWLMNKFIIVINNLSFSVVDNLPASVLSTWLLYIFVVFICSWLINKNKNYLYLSMTSILFFAILVCYNNWMTLHQKAIIVYNVPQHQSIDFVNGNNYQFVGDSILLVDGMLQNFHLKPARILLRLNNRVDSLSNVFKTENFYQFGDKRVLLIDKPINFEPLQQKIDVDMIVISKSPKLYISQLANVFNCKQYIFDASNSLWKIDKWKKDCEQLLLHHYSVPEQGAFIFNINEGANTNY